MDVRGNKVKLDDDTEISYNKCLIATGEALQTAFITDCVFKVAAANLSFPI